MLVQGQQLLVQGAKTTTDAIRGAGQPLYERVEDLDFEARALTRKCKWHGVRLLSSTRCHNKQATAQQRAAPQHRASPAGRKAHDRPQPIGRPLQAGGSWWLAVGGWHLVVGGLYALELLPYLAHRRRLYRLALVLRHVSIAASRRPGRPVAAMQQTATSTSGPPNN